MKAKDITVGMKVFMKVSGNVVPVRVDSINEREVFTYRNGGSRVRGGTTYGCTNLKTGRPCSARSASKFRGPVPPEMPTVRQATAMFDALDRKQEREADLARVRRIEETYSTERGATEEARQEAQALVEKHLPAEATLDHPIKIFL